MDFRILGPLEVEDGGHTLPLGGPKQRALLALLLTQANRVAATERLIEGLWRDDPPDGAAATIQVYVSQLRKLLEPNRKPREPYKILASKPPGYFLRLDPDQLDVYRFELLTEAGTAAMSAGDAQAAANSFRRALQLWRGSALAEFASEPWAIGEASRLNEMQVHALEQRIEADLALGRHAHLIAELESLVAVHPLRERLCGQLMLALYRSGRQAEASDIFQRTRERLVGDLGMEPGPELQKLLKLILNQDPQLTAPAEPSRLTLPLQGRLPAPLTRFIGRTADVTGLIRRLEEVRLLTLTGPGGIGKTRLAIELARNVSSSFPDGLWLIDLGPLSDPRLIPQVVAAALRVQEQPGRSLTETLARHLQDRRCLLVLDNCERVLGASADFAIDMLAECTSLKVLATSRERLGVAGEQVWKVAPLPVPQSGATLGELPESEAAQLFLDRASLVHPTLNLSESNASALVQICRRLDGIPLALELAAAQTSSLTIGEVAARLDDRLGLLVTTERGRPARHLTLQAALDWSYLLLDKPEQALFCRLGVFTGGFDLEAIDAICTVRDSSVSANLVERLVDKSLVLSDVADRNRFRMLETMREFARVRSLTADESQWLSREHARYFLNLVQTHGARLRASGATQHLAELDRNIDNIRGALEWARANDHSLLAQLTIGLHSYWTSRCSFHEALIWLGLAIPDSKSSFRQSLLASAGWIETATGQTELGREHSEQALAIAESLADSQCQVRALINLSESVGAQEGTQVAISYLYRAAAIAEHMQEFSRDSFADQAALGASLCMIASSQVKIGDLGAARANLVRGIEMAVQVGDCFIEALGYGWQSQVSLGDRDIEAAEDFARRGLELAISIDHRFLMLRCIGQLAAVAAEMGTSDKAIQLAAAVDSVRGVTGAQGFDKVDFWFGPGWPARQQRAREQLGLDRASELWELGGRLSVYDAAALALGERDSRKVPAL